MAALPTGRDSWSEQVGVRVAGLPADALDGSRIPLSTALALRITAADRELATDAEGICAELYALVATAPAQPFKPALIGLRRAVHRGARLSSLLDRAAPAEVIGAELTARIRRHTALRQAREQLFARLERELPEEVRSASTALAGLAEDPLFARGLGYASPDLYDDVVRWAGRERVGPGRRPLDSAAVRLAKYAARAVAKPSPLTTFAASGLGVWGKGLGAAAVLDSTGRAEVLEAGLPWPARIAAALAQLPELDRSARLRVNPFTTLVPSADGDHWLFTAPGPAGEVRALPATAALAAVLEAAREAGSPAALRALLRGPDGNTAGAGRTDAVLVQLLRLGILESRLGLPDQRLDVASLSEWLEAHLPRQGRAERPARVLDELRAIRSRMDAPGPVEPAAHRDITAELRTRTAGAAQRLGLTGADRTGPGPAYFHNTVVTGNAATLDADRWREVRADLALVPCLLAPFDTLGRGRDALLRGPWPSTAPGSGSRSSPCCGTSAPGGATPPRTSRTRAPRSGRRCC
ncbi:hypothetical protein GXW82_15390 [Streptacidiphilus sp. 4-A2]|nr:hypothetical protein [Streptacidiphilus sp. 4-A2]